MIANGTVSRALAREQRRFDESNPRSLALHAEAADRLVLGVPSWRAAMSRAC